MHLNKQHASKPKSQDSLDSFSFLLMHTVTTSLGAASERNFGPSNQSLTESDFLKAVSRVQTSAGFSSVLT